MKTKTIVALLSLALCCVSSARAESLEWARQFGTSTSDEGQGVSADGLGNVYISGQTFGDLGGPNAGEYDAFLSKYDAGGTLEWTQQFGTSSWDSGLLVSADGLGNVYITGGTYGSLGGPNAGGRDAFLSKYDAGGTLQWTQQFGTSSSDEGRGVSADGLGNVYISGLTEGDLGGPNAGYNDAFIRKYDASGTLQWTQQFGTSNSDSSLDASADGLGSVYIAGKINGDPELYLGEADAFISKYDASGTLEWTQQFGSAEYDLAGAVSADGLGNVYISGYTDGSLGGPNAGGSDAFVAKFGAPVPEPSSVMLLACGVVAGLIWWRRKK